MINLNLRTQAIMSDSNEKVAALKLKMDQMMEDYTIEMKAKKELMNNPEVVLDLNSHGPPLSPDLGSIKSEDTCEFTTDGPPSALCELKNIKSPAALALEVKEITDMKLQEELEKVQKELKLKDEEVVKLCQIRDEVGSELEELTASLFEEAHKMVWDANKKQANSEKLLTEANLKIDVLQAEVQALKSLVITSTPSMPNKHLHPQLEKKNSNGMRTLFHKGHKRFPSNYELESFQSPTTPPTSPVREAPPKEKLLDFNEMDPVFYQEFVNWSKEPLLEGPSPFLSRIYKEEILPCLNFTNKELTERVLNAMQANNITVEVVTGNNPFPKRCTLMDSPKLCKYRMKIGDSSEWNYISQICRNRIASVCDLFCYLRYIQQGLVKSGVSEMFWEVMRRRKDIALARLGFSTL